MGFWPLSYIEPWSVVKLFTDLAYHVNRTPVLAYVAFVFTNKKILKMSLNIGDLLVYHNANNLDLLSLVYKLLSCFLNRIGKTTRREPARTLVTQGVPIQYIRVLNMLYSGFTNELFFNDVVNVKRGVQKGDTISTRLGVTFEIIMGGQE